MEFLESHSINKTLWDNDTILAPAENKELSNNEVDNNEDDKDNKKLDKQEEGVEEQEKVADKVISDLEVIRYSDTFISYIVYRLFLNE